MSDIITGIMVKNMAREMVKRATAKNAVKTKSASKVLQLMDKDYSYQEAIKKVSAEDGISSAQLEKECEPFI